MTLGLAFELNRTMRQAPNVSLFRNKSTIHGEIALHGCDGEVKGVASAAESYAYAVFLLLQLLLSVFGNTLVCVAIIRFSHLQTLTNTFIFSLGITDLLTPFVRVLFTAVAMLRLEWIFGCFWCQLSSVLGVFLCASSILHLCAISVERFIVIRWPLRQHFLITKKRVVSVLVNIWVAALLCSLFPYFGIVKLTFNAELLDCEIYWMENPGMAVILACVFFFLPFLLMSVTYYYIFLEVRTQTRKISALQISQPEPDQTERKSAASSRIRTTRILREELKAVKTIVVVMGLFFGLWLPFFAITSVRAYRPENISGPVQRLAFAMAYSNSSCNWIVYSIMNKELRKAFKKMLSPFLCCRWPQRRVTTRQIHPHVPEMQARSDASMKGTSTESPRSVRDGLFKKGNKSYAATKKDSNGKDSRQERPSKVRITEQNFLDLRGDFDNVVS